MFEEEYFNLSLDKNIDEEVDKIYQFYKTYGFPNYEKESYDIQKEFEKMLKFNEASIYDSETKIIKQNMTGLGILWSYFPHWIEVKCGTSKQSLKELWNDEELVKKLIKKTYLWKCKHNEPHWTNNRIRQNAKVFLSKQSVSNFRPTVAKYIYNTYGNNGSILDMSTGYGGRFFGFVSSNCKEYYGTDPCEKSFNSLNDFIKDLGDKDKSIHLFKQGSEIFMEEWKEKFDLCFTSPPYFDTEKYSDEETQSYKKFPSIDKWLNEFLKVTINNCYQYTKDNGYLILNIANTPMYDTIESSTIKFATECGFKHIDTLKMELSSIAQNKSRKYEPVFVFQKNA